MKLIQTPSQTVGPYFAYGLTSEQYGYDFRSLFGPVVAESQASGEHIRLTGRVFDGDGVPIPDAMLEIRQADAEGHFVASRAEGRASGFSGFGRCGTGTHPALHYWFDTVKPGAASPGGAPCIDVIVTMRGMLLHAFTRIYFDDERDANARDPVLAALPADRRATLIATREQQPGGVIYRFDVRMQGPKETVFFDL
ncbi:MAG: protocatechuate 3,4-dioxygenase subunit alpha [Burkholderiales bacterium]